MGEFRMPSLGADMDAGTIVEWRVHPGDRVKRGDVVAVVDTDKADIDAEIFEEGVIGELLVEEGQKVAVGTVLATVITDSAAPAVAPVAAAPVAVAAELVAVAPSVDRGGEPSQHPATTSPLVRHLAERTGVDTHRLVGTGPGGTITRTDVEAAAHRHVTRPRVSPRARRLAAETGVDTATIRGSGPGGAVVGADLTAGEPAAEPTPAPSERGPRRDRTDTMRQRTAALMERSNREIPHYWITRDLDLADATRWIAERNAPLAPPQRIVPAALLLAATARAAFAQPNFNGRWIDGRFEPAATVDLGLVIAMRGGGLVVPVIHDAQTLTATEMMERLHDAVGRARGGHLRSSDVTDPTITVSNLGDQGADAVLGVIYPPQVALVGFGRVCERPWADHGMLGVRSVVSASIAGDHRVSDGHQASTFLMVVDRYLRDPDRLEEVNA